MAKETTKSKVIAAIKRGMGEYYCRTRDLVPKAAAHYKYEENGALTVLETYQQMAEGFYHEEAQAAYVELKKAGLLK